jgi:hypothetical protein
MKKDKEELPPMTDEPNQAEIDAEQARRLREATEKRKEEKMTVSELIHTLRNLTVNNAMDADPIIVLSVGGAVDEWTCQGVEKTFFLHTTNEYGSTTKFEIYNAVPCIVLTSEAIT